MSWKWVPKTVTAFVLWGVVGYVFWKVEPASIRDVVIPGLYLPMVMMVGGAVWYSSFVLSRSLRYAVLLALLVMGWMILSIVRWMNWLVGVALIGMVISLSLTLVKKS